MNQEIICDTCGLEYSSPCGRRILGKMFICDDCIDKILILHIHVNKIKLLCPFCNTINRNIKCPNCSLDNMLKAINYAK